MDGQARRAAREAGGRGEDARLAAAAAAVAAAAVALARAETAAAALAALRAGPCWLPDLARHLRRRPGDAAAVAWALCGLGLAVPIGPDVYARAGYAGPALRHCPGAGGVVADPGGRAPSPARAAEAGRRRERLAGHLDRPRALWEVAGRSGMTAKATLRLLGMMVAVGLAVRLGHGIYVRADRLAAVEPRTLPPPPCRRATPPGEVRPRRQPIRDSILAFLREPRSAGEVARHIRRSVPNATGHLAAMRRRGLVRRIGYAAYALEPYEGPPLRWDGRAGLLVPGSVADAASPFAGAPRRLPGDDAAEDARDGAD